jgi:hypothetical protein
MSWDIEEVNKSEKTSDSSLSFIRIVLLKIFNLYHKNEGDEE